VHHRLIRTGVAALLLAAAACEDQVGHREIQTEINVLCRNDAEEDDTRLALAQRRLVERGEAALPQIETSLHAAPERGRVRLVATLGALAHPEGVPILRHLAVYDLSAEVRAASEATLEGWAAGKDTPVKTAEKARAALRRVAELRARDPAP
jgi:hypothetical protein